MKLIADDELQLIDWTVVKLWYPDIQADNEEIFERMVKNTEWEDIKAVYFKNRKNWTFQKYVEEMRKKWFRLLWNEDGNDNFWKTMRQEFKRIFGMIVKERNPNYSTIIIDILWRAFSGYRNTDWVFSDEGNEENFCSCSPTSLKGNIRYCYLESGNGSPCFDIGSCEHGFPVVFVKDSFVQNSI